MEFILVKMAHYIGIFAVVGALFAEAVMLKGKMKRSEIKFLSKVDAVYGMGAILVVAMGLLMWFSYGKSPAYYSQNWILITKVATFGLIGTLSIWPTVFFIRAGKGEPDELIEMPLFLRWSIYVEVALLPLLPILAVLMANGFGSL